MTTAERISSRMSLYYDIKFDVIEKQAGLKKYIGHFTCKKTGETRRKFIYSRETYIIATDELSKQVHTEDIFRKEMSLIT